MALYFVGDEDINQDSGGFFFLDPHHINPSISSKEIDKPEDEVDLSQYLH